tara:strand:+ start:527 stop:847 length:321 start_codon:yes stop_codon:yes gene_type:complete
MKKTIYTVLFFLSISLNINAQSQNSSIDDVKRLNYDLLQEIGFDDSQINLVSRLLYSTAKKATYVSEKGVFPNKEILDNEFKTSFLKFFTEKDFANYKTIQHKIKF